MAFLDTTTFVENVKSFYNRIVKNGVNFHASEKKLEVEIGGDISTYPRRHRPDFEDQLTFIKTLLQIGFVMFLLTIAFFTVGFVLMGTTENTQCTINVCTPIGMKPASYGITLQSSLCEIDFPKFNTTISTVLTPKQILGYTIKGECPVSTYLPDKVDYTYSSYFIVSATCGLVTFLLVIIFLICMWKRHKALKEIDDAKNKFDEKIVDSDIPKESA